MPTVAAACCNRAVTEEDGDVASARLEDDPMGDWHYVGNGQGNYVQAPEYDYVGDGSGSYAPQRTITYRGWKFRRGCLQVVGAVGAITILGVVVALVVQSHRSATTNANGADSQESTFGQERQAAVLQTASRPTSQVASDATDNLSATASAQQVAKQTAQAQAPGDAAVVAGSAAEPAVDEQVQHDAKKRQAVPVFNCANTLSMSEMKGSYCCENFGKFCDAYTGANPVVAAGTVAVQQPGVVPQLGAVTAAPIGVPGSIVAPVLQPGAAAPGVPMTHMTGAVAGGAVAGGVVAPVVLPDMIAGAVGATAETGACSIIGCDAAYNPEQACQCNAKCMQYGNCCADHDMACAAGAVAIPRAAQAVPGLPPTYPPPAAMPGIAVTPVLSFPQGATV